jgi:hypothetical protein
VLHRLTTRLNGLPAPPDVTGSCPVSAGEHINAFFRYPDGGRNPVVIETDGCMYARNGKPLRWAAAAPGPKLLRQLRELTP